MEQAERLQNEIERAREVNKEEYKEGVLKDYEISLTVEINGLKEVKRFNFTHETVVDHVETFSSYCGQVVSDKVEQLIKDMIKVQHAN